ncbi:invasin domain 3-containing protein, partial [Pantoea sp. GbtcB22]|uniref:invasin domain 3-containing protein n=1 Tax=Pantoea sp. GbtcB22 TaxID=2824767 RepID=UPI001C3119A1
MSGAQTATLQETQSLSKKSPVAQAPVKAATLSSAREQSNGIYLVTLTAGTRPGSVSITPSIEGAALKAVTVAQVSDTAT